MNNPEFGSRNQTEEDDDFVPPPPSVEEEDISVEDLEVQEEAPSFDVCIKMLKEALVFLFSRNLVNERDYNSIIGYKSVLDYLGYLEADYDYSLDRLLSSDLLDEREKELLRRFKEKRKSLKLH